MEFTEATLFVSSDEFDQPIEVQGALFHFTPASTTFRPVGQAGGTTYILAGELRIICPRGGWWSSATSIEIHPLDETPLAFAVRRASSSPHPDGQSITYYADRL